MIIGACSPGVCFPPLRCRRSELVSADDPFVTQTSVMKLLLEISWFHAIVSQSLEAGANVRPADAPAEVLGPPDSVSPSSASRLFLFRLRWIF